MNCLKSRRAWARYLEEIRRGLEAAGLDRDFFPIDDLQHLAKAKYTAQMVIDRARAIAARGAQA